MTSVIKESSRDAAYFQKNETLFTQGNGYLGIRGAFEEPYVWQTRGTFVAGVYNDFGKNEVSELVNLPDPLWMEFQINGERVELERSRVTEYMRTLDTADGEIKRSFVWHHSDGSRYRLQFNRFVSKSNKHLLAQQVQLTALDREAVVEWTTGFNGRQTNSGVQHLYELDKRVLPDTLAAAFETTESGIKIAMAARLKNSRHQPFQYTAERRQLIARTVGQVFPGTPLAFEKHTLIYTSHECPSAGSLLETTVEELAQCECDYGTQLQESGAEWKTFWKQSRVVVKGREQAAVHQKKLDWALYHLEIMCPRHSSAFSIPAKGLTGEGYSGHIFWETELFLMPFFLHTQPSIARKLLEYRYRCLPQAKENAKNNNWEGAQFPWESGLDGREETPKLSAFNIRTGRRQPVASALAEHHITADIAYAVQRYWEATGDAEFMDSMGKELLIETARFWISRASREEEKWGIKNVIGPDEYTEFVDNNAYTNYMAHFNVQSALQFIDEDDPLRSAAEEFLDRMYLPSPNPDRLLPQDDTFLTLPELDIRRYKESAGKQLILTEFSREEVNERQVLKQADVVMLLYVLPELFDAETAKKNLDYYEARTIHDSSLSKCIHSIVCLRNGEREKGEQFFEEALDIDFGSDPTTSLDGVHAGALGGMWLMVVAGFAGITEKNGVLSFRPLLPSFWEECSFPYVYRGRRLHIIIRKNEVTVQKLSGEELDIQIGHEKICLKEQVTRNLTR